MVLCTLDDQNQNRQQRLSSQFKALVHGEGCFPNFSEFNPLVVLDINTVWPET